MYSKKIWRGTTIHIHTPLPEANHACQRVQLKEMLEKGKDIAEEGLRLDIPVLWLLAKTTSSLPWIPVKTPIFPELKSATASKPRKPLAELV